MSQTQTSNFQSAATIMTVQDVMKSLEHYRDALGFRVAFTYGEPAFYAGVERGNVILHLHAADHTYRKPGNGGVYIFVDDVDVLYDELRSRGVRIEKPPQDYPYGMRDFDVRDPDGNQLSFGCESNKGSNG